MFDSQLRNKPNIQDQKEKANNHIITLQSYTEIGKKNGEVNNLAKTID